MELDWNLDISRDGTNGTLLGISTCRTSAKAVVQAAGSSAGGHPSSIIHSVIPEHLEVGEPRWGCRTSGLYSLGTILFVLPSEPEATLLSLLNMVMEKLWPWPGFLKVAVWLIWWTPYTYTGTVNALHLALSPCGRESYTLRSYYNGHSACGDKRDHSVFLQCCVLVSRPGKLDPLWGCGWNVPKYLLKGSWRPGSLLACIIAFPCHQLNLQCNSVVPQPEKMCFKFEFGELHR